METINSQPVENKVSHPRGYLDIVDLYLTLQGEGPFHGRPAVFIRTAGCNLSNLCKACDTLYTEGRKLYSPPQIVDHVLSVRKKGLVVFTGGEPLRQNIVPTVKLLINSGFFIQIETNGTYWLEELNRWTENRLHIVCSPKTVKLHPDILVDSYKYVLDSEHIDPEDGLPTSVLGSDIRPARPKPEDRKKPIYVAPADEKNEERNEKNLRASIQSVLQFDYILSSQDQKIWNLP